MIRIKLMDGTHMEIPREEALELLPYRGVLVSAMFKGPIEGLITHRGKVVPVLGPLPADPSPSAPVEQRPWILLLKGCAQAIWGTPEFLEEARSDVVPFPGARDAESELLREIDDLIKSA